MAQIENLDFDLDNFDLETIDIGSSTNDNKIGNLNMSNMLPKSQNNIKSISMNSTSQNMNNEISDSNEFGLDMLVNKNKARKDSGSNSPSLNNTSPSKPTPVGPEKKSFFSNPLKGLFSSSNDSNNNTNSNNGSNSLEDIDLDKELQDLDKGLDDNLNKIKSMSGPGLPDFGKNNNMESNTIPTVNVASSSFEPVDSSHMTYEEIQKAKFDLLCKFERLRDKGIKIPKTFSMSSDYDEMKYEYDRLLHLRKMDNSVKMQRQMLISFVSGTEWLNGKFDPFDLKLDGWSESVHDGINDYDDVFEELYEKYQGSGSMSPELRLMFMVGGSAFMYHISNSMFRSKLPNADEILNQNPDLKDQFQKAAMNSMGKKAPGFAGFMNNMMGGGGRSGVTDDGPPLYPGAGAGGSSSMGDMGSMNSGGDIPDLDTILKDIGS
tara:strand:- start:2947 stop:4248 length:1302 start_codon:yes stop_codon:yes gene_type:complete